MKFTIAIPTYNNVDTIGKTINSAIDQNFDGNYEILVVDNASSDGTDKFLDCYLGKITMIRNSETVSMFENHNVCLENAKGDYIIFCHSDDELLPNALLNYHTILEKRDFPSKYVLWGRSMFRDFQVNWLNGGGVLNQINSGIYSMNSFQEGGLTPSGTCYSRVSFKDISGFIVTTNSLAPCDMVTMWKLAINYFEFEMSDRIFFKREEATTATGSDLKVKKALYQATSSAIEGFVNFSNKREIEIFSSHVLNSSFYNPLVIRILITQKVIIKQKIRRKILKYFAMNPIEFLKLKSLKLLYAVFL